MTGDGELVMTGVVLHCGPGYDQAEERLKRGRSMKCSGIAAIVLGILIPASSVLGQQLLTVPATQDLSCALARQSPLNCTANDFTVGATFSAAPGTEPFCVAGQSFEFLVEFDLTSNQPPRYDVGFFVGQIGNNPINDVTNNCSVAMVPTSLVTPPPYTGTAANPWFNNNGPGNLCSDFFGPTGRSIVTVNKIKVKCQGDTTGSLTIPYLLAYGQSEGTCTGPGDVKPGTSAKCQASDGASVSGTVSVYSGAYVDVTKQTSPAGDSQSFSFTATGPVGSRVVALTGATLTPTSATGGTYTPPTSTAVNTTTTVTLQAGQTARFYLNALAANQTLTITEAAAAGWEPTASISCSAVAGAPTLTTNNATRTIQATLNTTNYAAACTVTNTKQPRVTITKVSNGSTGTFNFTGTNGWTSQDITTVTPGTGVAGTTQNLSASSTATELVESVPPAGFELAGISCTGLGSGGSATNDLANRKVTLNAAATASGTDIACTFTNNRQRTLTVTKGLAPVADTGQFVMNANGTTGAAAGNGATASALVSVGATATFSEVGSGGTNLSNYTSGYSCTTSPVTSGSGTSGSFTMPDADVTCTLTNTRKSASLTLRKTWVNGISGDSATVTSTGFSNDASSGLSTSTGNNTTTGGAVTVYAGESGTIGEAFGSGSAANYTPTLACTGTSGLSGSTLTVDPADSAIVCTLTNTLIAASGPDVSGTVYDDVNHNTSRDGGETGTGLAIHVKLGPRSGTSCLGPAAQVVAVAAAGDYTISGVSAGDYCLIISSNSDPSDTITSYPTGWIGTETPGGTRLITIGTTNLYNENFGLYNGSSLSGRVFIDNGSGGGSANNGTRDGSEAGIAGVTIRATDGAAVTYDTTTSGGSGGYTIWIPAGAANVAVTEINPPAHISTGGTSGTTGGSYTRNTDTTAFTAGDGVRHSGVDFGDVPENRFLTDGAQSALPGSVLYYPHVFTAGSAGTVDFSTAAIAFPANPGWSEVLYRDSNCNGQADTGEPQITAALTLAAGEQGCVLVKEFVPAGAPANAQNALTVTAAFTYTGASPALAAAATRVDVTTVGQAAAPGLYLTKAVDKAAALPGTTLVYTITYTNLGYEPLGVIVVNDATPAFTTFVSAGCVAPQPADITLCTVTQQPAVGAQGSIRWTLTGTLAPGATGSVTYSVQVQN